MKRLHKLWPHVVAFDNLLLAYRKARKGKRHRPAVALFGLKLEKELPKLQKELLEGSYCPGRYRLFTIYERKPRQIAAAPFRDRVVHHALMNIVEPLLDRRFIHDSYACRQDKGVHEAVNRYQRWAQRYRHALKMDVTRYFPSIDHIIMKEKLAHRIKDPKVLELFALLIDTSPRIKTPPVWYPGDDLLTPVERRTGIPIGNLTSQFLANLYLDDFDHYMKERAPAYLRYVDDCFVLGDDKIWLNEMQELAKARLAQDRLCLHPHKVHLFLTRRGVDVLGYRIWPNQRRLRKDNAYGFVRKLRGFAEAYAENKMDWADFDPSVQSWLGHAKHANTKSLREKLFSGIVFHRESAHQPAGVARRLLEQQTEEGARGEP
ncbi:MAG: RNA-dependent DNA polymerase [Gammaproteobacteria bacterium]|nr:RNA-dependent DNA polymerase [Gammaproteobacteria bacterium]